ncbi:MAG: hypothetical protein H7X77_01155 [Anaerolineae bacterium]|nr:hypothetical protein [Anaerolineae bacterium]
MNDFNLMQVAEAKRDELIRDAKNQRLVREINRIERTGRPTFWQSVKLVLRLPVRHPQPEVQPGYYNEPLCQPE